MIRPIPTSIEDFRDLREKGFEYIDKTHLITELLDRANYKVVLLPRPRRFGKSLNISTLACRASGREVPPAFPKISRHSHQLQGDEGQRF